MMAEGGRISVYSIFREFYDLLVVGVQQALPELADKAFARELITKSTHTTCTDPQQDVHRRAQGFVAAVLNQIEVDECFYEDFVSILREVPAISHLADKMEQRRTDGDPKPQKGAEKNVLEESGIADLSTSASADEEQQSETEGRLAQPYAGGAAVYTRPKPDPIPSDSVTIQDKRLSQGGAAFTLDSPNSDCSDHVPALELHEGKHSVVEHDCPNGSVTATASRPGSQGTQSPEHGDPPYVMPFQDTNGIGTRDDIDSAAANRHSVQDTHPHETPSAANPVVFSRKDSTNSLSSVAEPRSSALVDEAVKATTKIADLEKKLAQETQRANQESRRAEKESQNSASLHRQLQKEKKDVKQKLQEKDREIEDLKRTKEAETSRLNSEIDRLKSELAKKQRENHNMKETYESEIKKLQKQLKETENNYKDEILKLTKEKHALELTVAGMEKAEEKLKRQIAEEREQQAFLKVELERKDREDAEKRCEDAEKRVKEEQTQRENERRESQLEVEELKKVIRQLSLNELAEHPKLPDDLPQSPDTVK